MSEAIWIELIKILPTFLWILFGLVALLVLKRILTAHAPRMKRIETPWVSVDLAEMAAEAIQQAAVRGPATPAEEQPVPPWAIPPVKMPDAEQREAEPVPVGSPPASDFGPPQSIPAQQQFGGDGYGGAPGGHTPQPVDAFGAAPGGHSAQAAATADFTSSAPIPPHRQPPAFQPSSEDAQRGLRAATRLALSAEQLKGGAILWVDDHHEWNEPLIRLFRAAGIWVHLVRSTDDALRALKDGSYDLVITDMRRADEPYNETAGVELLDRMSEDGALTPAVVFSDHPNAKASVHARAASATNSPEDLVNVVVDVVGNHRNRYVGGGGWFNRS